MTLQGGNMLSGRRTQFYVTQTVLSPRKTKKMVVMNGMERVSVVLVSPKNPQNVGSVLRIAANMNVGRVILVDPRCDPEDPVISTVACNSPLLPEKLHVEDTLSGALKESMVSLCFSRRAGKGRRTVPSLAAFLENEPRSFYLQYLRDTGSDDNSIMLVFGREESGLTEDEVNACGHCIEIPSNPSFPSLNLSHAVAVIVSQLYQFCSIHGTTDTDDTPNNQDQQATHEEVEALFQQFTHCLDTLNIDSAESRGGGDKSNHGRRKLAPGHVRTILLRSKATQREVRSLFNLVKSIESSIDPHSK
jgi:TrmH family RNA methyltransferase